mmetsp:Transcript_13/g.106  ORF Transcript_13/g.106 Transcript_13/m.106 type:complete len:355 (+) Transcript_13:200-1264(+)
MDRDRHETILRGGDPATDHDPRVQHRERRRTMRRIHGMVWLLWIWLATRVDGNDLDRIRWERYACDGRERNASQTCVERDESLSRWMRRQMRSPRYAALSCYVDKSAAKHYATTQVPWLKAPETLAIYNNGTIPQLKRKEMPPSYALKSTHGSNLVMLVTNGYIYKGNAGRLYKNQFLTRRKITKIGMLFLRTCKQCRREVQYRNVQRAVLVEEFLGTGLPVAYKVHVMSGDVVALDLDYFVVTNSTTGHARNRVKRIVERDATALSAQFAHRGCSSLQQQPPVHAMELLFHAARQLASGFRYLRADFFWFNASWYFGELTLSPQAGVGRMDLWFGQKFLAKIGYCAQVMTNYP